MFQLPVSEFEIRCDMAERQSGPTETYPWFHPTASTQPNWLAKAIGASGRMLKTLGQQLETYSLQLTSAPTH